MNCNTTHYRANSSSVPGDPTQASTSFLLPTFGAIARESFTLPPAEFAARRTREFLANAVTTYSYRLAPFGMELGRAGGRILLPSLDHHPRGPSPRVPPELRGPGLPSELDVLLAALGDKDSTNAVNHLADPTWRGEGNADFATIFAGSPFAPTVANRNLSLRDDYFPHGGFLGAGILDLPALLVRPIPPSFGTALDASQPAATRLVALQDFVGNHLLRTERVGELAFYLPAPNPPLDRFPTTPQELVDSLRNFVPSDPLHLNTYYPADEGFFQGWIDTPVLGLPTVRSRAAWEPQFARIRLDAEVPTNSWFNRYLGRARFAADLRGNTNQAATVAATFSTLSNQLARLTPSSPGLTATIGDIARRLPGELAQGLPKLSAALDVAQVRIPVPTYSPDVPLSDAQTIVRIRSATLEAYSPAFQRPGATGDGALDRVRRDGGFAVRGDFDFLNGVVSIPGAELAVTPDPNPLGLPRIAGSLTGGPARFFGIPFGAPPAAGPSLHALAPGGVRIEFDAGPDRVRLEARGSIASLNLGPLASLTPLSGTSLGASAVFETTTSELPRGTLAIQPCRFASPLLGTTIVRLHGATSNAPFTVDPAGPWKASVSITPNSGIDLQLAGERVLRLARASSAPPFRATLSAVGLANPELVFTNLHLGFTVETYPDERAGDPRRRTFTLGAGVDASLRIAGDGTVDFRVTIPETLALPGTTVAGLDTGFELRVSPADLTFSGTASGGLWAALGGSSLAVTVTTASDALAFSAQAGLPPLQFGVFRVEDDAGRGPRVTLSNAGISLPAGLILRAEVPAFRSPVLTLDRFVISAQGTFQVVGQVGGAFEYDGLSFASPTHTFARNASGTVTYTVGGNVPPRDLPGFGSIQPRSGSTLRASAIASTDGSVALALDAALLRLTPVGVNVEALLHGAASTNAPFTYTTFGPWSASATFPSLIVDPPGAALPEFVRLAPASGSSLFTATVAGNQGSLTSLAATRTGSVHFELFRGSPMARAFTNVNAGTVSLALATSPSRLNLTLNPPDLAYATNFVVGNKLVFVDLFRIASDSLRVTVASDAALDRSIKLDAPTLTLLPGTLLERSLTALPTQTLAPATFAVFTGTPFRTLGFPGLPVVRLPSGATGLLTLSPAGFTSPIPLQEGVAYGGLIALPASSSQLSLDFTGSRLRLRFATGPSATVLGRPLALDGGEATLEVATGGGFTGTFRATAAPPRNLANSLLGFLPSGHLTLDGLASDLAPNYRLVGELALAVAYPNPSNPTQSLTHQRSVDFDLGTDGNFSATLTSDLPAFDLGWLRVQRGNDGQVVLQRNGATGDFTLAFQDWDVRVLGFDYDNQDFTVGAAGTLTRALPAASFSLGSGTSRLRLVSGGTLAFDWLASPDNANPGRTFLDLPATTSLSFTNVPGLSGTLLTGFPLGAALSDIPAAGTFDRTWNQALVLNNLDFGTVSARLRRTTHGGPIQFTASRDNAFWSNLDLSISASTSGSDTFAASLAGTFSVGGWDFGSASFSFHGSDPTAPFQGSATITDPSGNVGFTTGIKLRGGAKPCLEFIFGGFTRTLCVP